MVTPVSVVLTGSKTLSCPVFRVQVPILASTNSDTLVSFLYMLLAIKNGSDDAGAHAAVEAHALASGQAWLFFGVHSSSDIVQIGNSVELRFKSEMVQIGNTVEPRTVHIGNSTSFFGNILPISRFNRQRIAQRCRP